MKQSIPPPENRRGTLACVVLAAGMSLRFGSQKQLYKIDGKKTLVQVALDTANKSRFEYVLIVVGSDASNILRLVDLGRAVVVYNKEYKSGIASSIRAGIANIPSDCSAALFMVADQPFLESNILDQMLDHYLRGEKRIIALACGGEIRNPVLFDKVFFPEIEKLQSDHGAKGVAERHVKDGETYLLNIDDERAFTDVDTKENLENLS